MDSNNIDYTKYDSIGPRKIKAISNVMVANYASAMNAYFQQLDSAAG